MERDYGAVAELIPILLFQDSGYPDPDLLFFQQAGRHFAGFKSVFILTWVRMYRFHQTHLKNCR